MFQNDEKANFQFLNDISHLLRVKRKHVATVSQSAYKASDYATFRVENAFLTYMTR